MKNNFGETVLYYVVGLIYPVAYYLLMTEFFKKSPFEGWVTLLTIYFLVCYVLYPFSSRIVNKKTEDSKVSILMESKSVLFFAYLFGPFILLREKLKK